jgi:pSer/pThr/pTyr-binding forkhead associated (FHA) protein
MSDQILNILKLSLLGLIYLFFARVLWAVWSEVRATKGAVARPQQRAGAPAATAPQPRPAAAATAAGRKASKGKGGRVARIVMIEPSHRKGTAVALQGELTLGRDDGCSITIDDDSFVSTLHLRFYDYDGQPMVEDLNSTNGTFHNGTRLHGSRPLQPGDRIQVGTTVMEAQ